MTASVAVVLVPKVLVTRGPEAAEPSWVDVLNRPIEDVAIASAVYHIADELLVAGDDEWWDDQIDGQLARLAEELRATLVPRGSSRSAFEYLVKRHLRALRAEAKEASA